MTALSAMVNATFRDSNLALDAVYRPGGIGTGFAVRITFGAPDRTAPFGEGRYVTNTHLIEIRVSEAANLAASDSFQIGAAIYVVQGDPLRDLAQLVWSAEVRPV